MTSELTTFNHLRCHSSSTAWLLKANSERCRWNPPMKATQPKAVSFIIVNIFFHINGIMRVPKCDLHCHCILSIFPAGVHQFYANIFALVNIKLFLYINDQFGNANKNFVCLLIWKHKFCRGIQMAIFFAISVFARIKKMGSDNENSHTRLSLVL